MSFVDSQLQKLSILISPNSSTYNNHELRTNSYQDINIIDHNLEVKVLDVYLVGGEARSFSFNLQRRGCISFGQHHENTNSSSSDQSLQNIGKK